MNPPVPTDAWLTWHDATGREDVTAGLVNIYDQLDRAIAERQPHCDISGRCCRFDTFGHKLYVTGLEVAWLLRQIDNAQHEQLELAPLPHMDGCPFQVDSRCSVHAVRPLGCRIFFCDPTAEAWMSEAYEHFLDALRTLHDKFALPYHYMEWRAALAAAKSQRLRYHDRP